MTVVFGRDNVRVHDPDQGQRRSVRRQSDGFVEASVPRFSLWLPMVTCESAQTPERDKRWSYFDGQRPPPQSPPH